MQYSVASQNTLLLVNSTSTNRFGMAGRRDIFSIFSYLRIFISNADHTSLSTPVELTNSNVSCDALNDTARGTVMNGRGVAPTLLHLSSPEFLQC